MKWKGFILVLSAPSGTGKTTIRKGVVEKSQDVVYSVSATTRPKREGEEDGVDYVFLSEDEFKHRLDQGDFAEWTQYQGFLYGTLRKTLVDALSNEKVIISVVEVGGARNLKKIFSKDCATVFIAPPSIEVLEKRLKARRTDSRDVIKRRLNAGRKEMENIAEYDYVIVNENLHDSILRIQAIIEAERHRTKRLITIFD